MKEKLLSPWLTVRVQFVLAAFFVVAAVAKIADPPGFAHEIHNYRLLPAAAVNALALTLPWLELLAGLALFLGLWRRTAAGVLALLLVVFIGALSINLARRHPVDCGCFGTSRVERTDAERLAEMKLAILRDVGLIALAAQILAATREG
ncbi:MAG: MauE/DoxX family redox-associated membrane protein [Thermoanaerobaculia bacterium]